MPSQACLARYFLAVLTGLLPPSAAAERVQVAVASNFKPAMEALTLVFTANTGHELAVNYGSTGKHFAQIVNGAPFDLFLAADAERPRRLEADGFAVAGTRFTYALGKLVLWSPDPDRFEGGAQALAEGDFRFLAVANPRTAPYGLAAEQTLRNLALWDRLQRRIVRAESVGQAFAYVRSGNAQLGFVALSQVAGPDGPTRGSSWVVPCNLYQPIEQQAVLLADKDAARAFLAFVRGERAADLIRAHGYAVPR